MTSIRTTNDRQPVIVLTFLAIAFSVIPLSAQQTAGEKVENTRELLGKWVETRRLISKEKQDWALGQEVLQDRIDLIQQEIASFSKRIKDAKKSLSELDKKKGALAKELGTLKEAGDVLTQSIRPLENRLSSLLVGVPAPLLERVEPLSRRFPRSDAKEIKLSLSERFQNVIGVLNAINKFNSEINVASEVRDLGDGKTAEVTALYIGISQGYYANAAGDRGGVGSSSSGKWIWHPQNSAAAKISKAIKILNNEEVAGYVLLPLEIK